MNSNPLTNHSIIRKSKYIIYVDKKMTVYIDTWNKTMNSSSITFDPFSWWGSCNSQTLQQKKYNYSIYQYILDLRLSLNVILPFYFFKKFSLVNPY